MVAAQAHGSGGKVRFHFRLINVHHLRAEVLTANWALCGVRIGNP
jgi:hypothetical protein